MFDGMNEFIIRRGLDLYSLLEEDDPSPTRFIYPFMYSNLISGEQPEAFAASGQCDEAGPNSSVPSPESEAESSDTDGGFNAKASASPPPPSARKPPPPPPPPAAKTAYPWREAKRPAAAIASSSASLSSASSSSSTTAAKAKMGPRPPNFPPPPPIVHIGPPHLEHDPVFQSIEAENAKRFNIHWSKRGPPEPADKSVTWKGMPWDDVKKCWRYTHRSQLPREYTDAFQSYDDWWDKLDLEASLAKEHMIPALFRGPPHGPPPQDPQRLWRGAQWRKESQKWCNRGGANLAERNAKCKGRGKRK